MESNPLQVITQRLQQQQDDLHAMLRLLERLMDMVERVQSTQAQHARMLQDVTAWMQQQNRQPPAA